MTTNAGLRSPDFRIRLALDLKGHVEPARSSSRHCDGCYHYTGVCANHSGAANLILYGTIRSGNATDFTMHDATCGDMHVLVPHNVANAPGALSFGTYAGPGSTVKAIVYGTCSTAGVSAAEVGFGSVPSTVAHQFAAQPVDSSSPDVAGPFGFRFGPAPFDQPSANQCVRSNGDQRQHGRHGPNGSCIFLLVFRLRLQPERWFEYILSGDHVEASANVLRRTGFLRQRL